MCRVVHRIGELEVGETAIIAMAYAAHRREAFAACEEAVERVKHEVASLERRVLSGW